MRRTAARPYTPPGARVRLGLVVLGAILLLFAGTAPAVASPYPPLNIALDRDFLGNLTGPDLNPGGSGTLAFTVSDPLSSALSGVVVTLAVYAFNQFPGNATSLLPVAGAPVLSTPSGSGDSVNVSLGTISPGRTVPGSIGVTTSSSTPRGEFAVRTAVAFTLASNGTAYRLESRGWFSTATWLAATELPNGSTTLNLSVLGVSGVTPETAIYIAGNSFDWALGAILVAGFACVGVGAWLYFRKGPGSRSGAR